MVGIICCKMVFGKKNKHRNWFQEMGVEYYFTDIPRTEIVEPVKVLQPPPISFSEKTPKKRQAQHKIIETSEAAAQARFLVDKASDIEELREIVTSFTLCPLRDFATNCVFADGVRTAKIMCIGEAPGNSEDLAGIPFCGESGKLLDQMLAAIGLSRKTNVYITNSVFWRPPANRNPTLEETNICRPFLEKHIALIKPSLIILIGNVAANSLLGTTEGITKIKQRYYSYNNQYLENTINTTAIFHPAYLLRQPMQKKATWYDLLRIKEFIKSLP